MSHPDLNRFLYAEPDRPAARVRLDVRHVAVVSLPESFGAMQDVTFSDALGHVLRIPHGPGSDHAEGPAKLTDGRLLVVYDSPAPHACTTMARARTPTSSIRASGGTTLEQLGDTPR
jgi:hypothetical protein